jgi:hypothetical protein
LVWNHFINCRDIEPPWVARLTSRAVSSFAIAIVICKFFPSNLRQTLGIWVKQMTVATETNLDDKSDYEKFISSAEEIAAQCNYFESASGSPLIRLVFSKLMHATVHRDDPQLGPQADAVILLHQRLIVLLKAARLGARPVVEADIQDTIAKLEASLVAIAAHDKKTVIFFCDRDVCR